MTIDFKKCLSPWIASKNKECYNRFILNSKFGFYIYKGFDKKIGGCWMYLLFGENRSYRNVEDAMFEHDKILVIEGYVLLTEEQYEKYSLLI
jgi:hypothetical protein